MVLKISGHTTTQRINSICTTNYYCQPGECELSSNFAENPSVNIMHKRPVDGGVLVTISGDNMKATATFLPPINSGRMPTVDEAMEMTFSAMGIKRALADMNAFQKAYDEASTGVIVDGAVVAVGRQPVHGDDAKITTNFDIPSEKPIVREGGKAYYQEQNRYINVRKDQLLIRIMPHTEGTPGLTIMGNPIPQVSGREATVSATEGVRVDEQTKSYYAAYDGYIIYKSGILSVRDTIEVKGNLDFSIGNINFTGTVIIHGDVLSGFVVKGRDVIIDGLCLDALVVADNDITVRLGVKGGQGENFLNAGGNIEVGYCDNANLNAKGDIIIKKYAFNSMLNAGGRVDASDRTTVTGGEINTFSGGSFYNVGTKANSRITIRTGRKYTMKEKLDRINAEKDRLQESLDRINSVLEPLSKTKDTKLLENPKIKKLMETKELIIKRVELFDRRVESIMKESIHDAPAIDVLNEVQEGVRIVFFDAVLTIRKMMKKKKFFYETATSVVNFRDL